MQYINFEVVSPEYHEYLLNETAQCLLKKNYCNKAILKLITWMERQVEDSQRLGMSQSCSRSETGITSRYLEITSSSFAYNIYI